MTHPFSCLPEKIRDGLAQEACPRSGVSGNCWVWTGRTNRNGYGRIWWEKKEPVLHRVVWLILRGAIPAGLVLDHLCKVRRCCNPDHLEPVTTKVNVQRGDAILFRPAPVCEATP